MHTPLIPKMDNIFINIRLIQPELNKYCSFHKTLDGDCEALLILNYTKSNNKDEIMLITLNLNNNVQVNPFGVAY